MSESLTDVAAVQQAQQNAIDDLTRAYSELADLYEKLKAEVAELQRGRQ